MDYRFGTCGFSYSDWVGPFYPAGAKGTELLAHYATCFDTVELDTTFHAVPAPRVVHRWASVTPDNFRFCVKAPHEVTHTGVLHARLPAMHHFLDVMRELKEKLGVVLLQFPPSFTFRDFPTLEKFLIQLPTDLRFATEFRHASWLSDQTTQLLRDHRVCWAVGDYGLSDPDPVRLTTDFLYIRWIGQHGAFEKHAREQLDVQQRLQWWHKQLLLLPFRVKTVWGMGNNDYSGYAVGTINRMRELMVMEVREAVASGGLFD